MICRSHNIFVSTHANEQLCLCSLCWNLQIQGENPPVILVWLNNHCSLLTRISHLSSTDSIRPFYSIAPGATHTSTLLCFSTHPSCSHPSCYTHKTTGDRNVFFLLHSSLHVAQPSFPHLSYALESQILSETGRQTCRKYNWHTQLESFKWLQASQHVAALSMFSLCVFLFALPFPFTSLWARTKRMLVNQNMIKWDFSMLPTATDKLWVCTCVQV